MILFTCLIQKIHKTIASMVNGHYLPLFLTHITFKDHEYGNVSVQDKSSSSSLTYSADPWCHHDRSDATSSSMRVGLCLPPGQELWNWIYKTKTLLIKIKKKHKFLFITIAVVSKKYMSVNTECECGTQNSQGMTKVVFWLLGNYIKVTKYTFICPHSNKPGLPVLKRTR